LIRTLYPDDAALAARIQSLAGFQKLRRQPAADRDRIAELLRSSWFTELLLVESGGYPDLLPYASPWTMVQAYYALYLAVRAYFLAYRRVVGHAHQATLRTLSADLLSCKDRFPPPWTCVLEGDPAETPLYLTNAPRRQALQLRNPLTSLARAGLWDHFGLFLRTTRQRQLQASVDRWKAEQGRRRVQQAERAGLLSRLRATSLFDALYRVRARSNYQDVDSFAFGNVGIEEAQTLHDAVVELVQTTLLVFEMMIARATGVRWFAAVLEDFVGSTAGGPAADTAQARWGHIRLALRQGSS
jgi:hypothetical protein